MQCRRRYQLLVSLTSSDLSSVMSCHLNVLSHKSLVYCPSSLQVTSRVSFRSGICIRLEDSCSTCFYLSVGSLLRSHARIRSPRASLRSAGRSHVLSLSGDAGCCQPYVALVRGADQSWLPSAEMSDEEDDHDSLSEDQLADKKLKAAHAWGRGLCPAEGVRLYGGP